MSMQNAIASQQRVGGILETAMSSAIDDVRGVKGIEEAVSVSRVAGSDLGGRLANLEASIASMAQMVASIVTK